MKPPTYDDYPQLVARIIASRPGISFNELAISSSIWSGELASITRTLRDQRIIEARDGRLFVRERRKKVEQPPSRWSHLRAFFRGN
jgi:hypothetical protein